MVFAIERTSNALHFLSLEKIITGYRVAYYDKRLPGALMGGLQDMGLTPGSEILMALNDADLIMTHICLDATKTCNNIYLRCQEKLAEVLPQAIKEYSWDAYPVSAYKGEGHYCLCAAYPLESILFLQQTCTLSQVRLKILEPSVCALARASLMLLKMPQALFLLNQNHVFTLVLAIQGEVFSLRQFNHYDDLEQNIAKLPIRPEQLIFINAEPTTKITLPHVQTIDMMQYLQGSHNLHTAGVQLLPSVGLALRVL